MHNRNFLSLGLGEAVARVISFAGAGYLARVLGAETYGIIAFAAGLTLYVSTLSDFGIEEFGSSRIAKNPEQTPSLASSILGARLAVVSVLVLSSSLVVWFLASDVERAVLGLYLLTLFPTAISTRWIYLGLQKAAPIAAFRVIGATVSLMIVVMFVRDMSRIWVVPLSVLAGDAVTSVGLYVKMYLGGQRFGARWAPRVALPVYRSALPLVGQLMLGLLLYNMDVFMLRVFVDVEAVGHYAVAYLLLGFLANIGAVYAKSVLPGFASRRQDIAEEVALYHTATAEVFTATLPIAVGGTFVANTIISIGFGPEYLPSVLPLQVLIWVILPATLRNVPWAALIARDRAGFLFKSTLIAVVANGVLNIVLINMIGLVGAAIATLAAEPFIGGLMFYYAAKEGLPVVPLRRLWPPVLAVGVMALALWILSPSPVALLIPVGFAAYTGSLAALGCIRFRGWVPVLQV